LENDNLTKGWVKREKGTTIVGSSAMRSPPNNPIRIISAICSRVRLARLSAAQQPAYNFNSRGETLPSEWGTSGRFPPLLGE
jgi:hypothetical protein